MKLQPGIRPFPVLGFWGKTPCHTPVPWHIAGICRPLPVSRVLSEEQRKAIQGIYSLILSVVHRCRVCGWARRPAAAAISPLSETTAPPAILDTRFLIQFYSPVWWVFKVAEGLLRGGSHLETCHLDLGLPVVSAPSLRFGEGK